LTPHIRLHNFIRKSGAAENKVESFITKVTSDDVSPEKVIELVNQLYDICNQRSIPLHEVPSYIEKK
jgi:hypothetical protein